MVKPTGANAKYLRCHNRALCTAIKMGYMVESHGAHETNTCHKDTGVQVKIPCAQHPRKAFTYVAWARIMSELVMGATDDLQG